ncbi:MAG: VWA domain-containing protein, partial [Lachnospiraceae bacterium]|nr:VWA domain-containing protein [Lachnospiraceae bacterium]
PTSGRIHLPGSIQSQLALGTDLTEGILPDSLRFQKIAGRGRINLLFLIDTSGSILADHRFANVKGYIISLLENSYARKIHVAIIRYGGGTASLELPFTTSAELAAKKIEGLRGGGSTPLIPALGIAAGILDRMKEEHVHIYLLSDGRYDRSRTGHENRQIREFGSRCRAGDVPVTFINAGAATRTARARSAFLARLLQAECIPLEDLRA